MEENQNIMNATAELLNSEEYKRMSTSTQTNVLSRKIIDIRDEYRHVLALLKS